MIHLLAIALAMIGFACLCLAMPRHQHDLIGRRLARLQSQCLRATGLLVLTGSFAFDAIALGAAHGAIAWCGHLSIGAAFVVGWHCWRASRHAASTPRKPTIVKERIDEKTVAADAGCDHPVDTRRRA